MNNEISIYLSLRGGAWDTHACTDLKNKIQEILLKNSTQVYKLTVNTIWPRKCIMKTIPT